MNERFTVAALVRSVWSDFRRAWSVLVVFEVLFKLLEAWLFVPAVALLLSAALARGGHFAVSNWDILDFLLSPPGLAYAVLFGTVAGVLLVVEQAGIMVLAAGNVVIDRPPVMPVIRAAVLKTLDVGRLGAKTTLLALTFAPFLGLAFLTYSLFLSRHDINYYLNDRPTAFWLAAGIGALIGAAALATGLILYVRWAFALPIVLFEGPLARAALRASRERTRGVAWSLGVVLIGWYLGALLLGMGVQASFRLVAAALLENAGQRPIAFMVVLLAVDAGLLASSSFVAVVGQALITRRLYLRRREQLGLLPPDDSTPAPAGLEPTSAWTRMAIYFFIAVVLVAPLALWANLTRYPTVGHQVRVTAHRGHSRAAPENTLAAIEKAIESKADYAEVDVQQTADGVVILLHDRDLMRVAGVPLRSGNLSYDELQKLDVGVWFGSAFAGERVPTLAEVITLCRGRIRLNIELKFYDSDRRLAPAVARLVREQAFEADCLVTSFKYDALLELKRHNPRLRTGIIVAQALGDVSRLPVEALSVRAEGLSDPLLHAAQRNGREVHVWTVNDARQMARLIERGVDNIITDDPDTLRRVRDEWASLAGTERLLLASRLLLGLDQ